MSAESECIMLRGPYGLDCCPHINSELEVICATKGMIEVTVSGTALQLQQGHAVLILPYQPHCFHPVGEATGRVYMFSYRIAADFYNSHCRLGLRPFAFPLPRHLTEYLQEATLRAEQHPDERTSKSIFIPLVAEYTENIDTSAPRSPHSALVDQLMDYILNHLQDKITLKTMSTHFGINTATLSKLIKDYTYESFTDFVNNIRIERAISLFYEQDVSVTEAASQAGFGSVRNFNRVFQATLGITPSEYRRQKH